MKRIALVTLMGLAVLFSMGGICGPKPPPPEPPPVIDIQEPVVVDTPDTPPPPPPPPELRQEQLQTAYFDFDKSILRGDAKTALDANFDLLMEFTDAIIKIEGHCDERGTVEYNQSLGAKRAQSTMDYLIGRGVPANRLSTVSYGKERPVDSGRTEAAWQKNRRCEFRIISQ